MARPSSFERTDVLDRALEAFWKTGYRATSIPELEAATGLGRGSLYNSFGDKEALFLAVIERYQQRFSAPPLAHLQRENVEDGIRNMLLAIIERMGRKDLPSGCLIANSVAECVGDGAVDSVISGSLAQLEHTLDIAIKRAAKCGQIPADTKSLPLARFFVAISQSLALVHRASGDVKRLRDIVNVAMTSWPGKVVV